MRKLRMFGFAFMAMFVGIMSTHAFTLTSSGSDVTFKKENENEKFSYEVVKIESSNWSEEKQTELDLYVQQFNTYSNALSVSANQYPNDLAEYDSALKAYNASATDENKEALEFARTKLENRVNDIDSTKSSIKSVVTDMSNLLGWDLFKGESLITPSEVEGKIDLGDPYDPAAIYVVYVKNDCFAAFNSFSVMPFAAYKNGDNLLGDINPDNIPLLDDEFKFPDDVPTTDEDKKDNTSTTDKKDDVKNPKTGVSMPVALGFSVVALAGAGMFIVCKKQLFKQL